LGKIGRNKPCFCGSGNKFKLCCIDKNEEEYQNTSDYQNSFLDISKNFEKLLDIQKINYDYKTCLAPNSLRRECDGNIVIAHSVSKSSMLKKIDEDGMVYYFDKSFIKYVKKQSITLKKTPINSASTFTGFCSYHDNKLFKEFEDSSFKIKPNQLALLSYRAICRELYTKRVTQNNFKDKTDLLKSNPPNKFSSEIINTYLIGSDLGISDLEKQKSIYDEMIIKNNFDDYFYFVLEFENIPEILCSSGKLLIYDLSGNNLIEDIESDSPLENIQFNISVFNNKTYVHWGWTKYSSELAVKYVKYFDEYSKTNWGNLIVSYSLANFENNCLSPKFVDKEDNALIIEKLMNTFASTERIKLEDYVENFKLNWFFSNKYKNF